MYIIIIDLEEQGVLLDIDEQNDLEEQDKGVKYKAGESNDLHNEESMEDYYSRMLKQSRASTKITVRLTSF